MSNDNFEHSFSSCIELQQTILPSSGIAFGLAVRSGMRSTASQGVNRNSGFTLIELMVVVVIVAIFAAIAIPSYQAYVRRAVASQTQQEMQRIAALLERHKARNFSYQKFDLSMQGVTAPRTYSFELKDTATGNADLKVTTVGRSWVLKATTTDAKNFNYLLTSTGIRCKNITAANITYSTCGVGSEAW